VFIRIFSQNIRQIITIFQSCFLGTQQILSTACHTDESTINDLGVLGMSDKLWEEARLRLGTLSMFSVRQAILGVRLSSIKLMILRSIVVSLGRSSSPTPIPPALFPKLQI